MKIPRASGGRRLNGIENGEPNLTLRFMGSILRSGAAFALVLLAVSGLRAQEAGDLKRPEELIAVQDPPKTVPRVLEGAQPDQTRIVVSLGRQRVYLYVGDEVAIDAPVSTGKRRGRTPVGEYAITEKLARHRSPLFGEFLDAEGRVVRSGVSIRIDAAPSGTTFRPVDARHYLRLTPEGLALHAGPLPGYPAADTAVRLPADIAPLLFQRVRIGTPVRIEE